MNAEADMTSSPLDVAAVSDSPFHLLLSAIRHYSTGLDRLHGLFEEHLINLDTTALVAMVTGTSNGCTEQLLKAPEDEMRRHFKSNFNFLLTQSSTGQSFYSNNRPTNYSEVVFKEQGYIWYW